MRKAASTPASIDEYIAAFPADVRKRLRSIRRTIRKAAPGAEERISYRIPAFTFGGNLIYFAAYQNHIGVYPGAAAIAAMKADLTGYRTAKGTVQLPLDQPLPLPLIDKLVQFKIEHNSRRAKGK
ncbi:MAG: DUF1801 domain-containing protein [Casimicrobiaceae bacterium]